MKWVKTHIDDRYEVSDQGDIRKNGVVCPQRSNQDGYPCVSVAGKTQRVHRLVGIALVPNPDKKPEINHINGDKSDNRAANLEWCTRSENMKHAYATGLHPGVSLCGPDHPSYGRRGAKHTQSVPVRAIFADGTTQDFDGMSDAARQGYHLSGISCCVRGRIKTHRGAKWVRLPPTTD